MTQTNREPRRAPAPGARPAGQRAAAGQRRPAPRPAPRPAAGRAGGGPKADLIKIIIGGVVACVLALVLQCAWPNGFPIVEKQASDTGVVVEMVSEIYSPGPVRLNEIVTSNRRTLVLDNEASPDWIEVANISNNAVNLEGYTLSKAADDARVFTFPEITLGAGECILVYADSRLRETAGEDLHAPYRLSSAGDTLMLFNAGGTAIDTVNIPALEGDQAYARKDTSLWEPMTPATPGAENSDAGYQSLQTPIENSPVALTEIMTTNTSTYPDENSQYSDYIELHNVGGETVNLAGWYLTDDVENLRKWKFPEVQLGAGEYLVVHASRLDRKDDPAHLHTNFALSSEGEDVLLVNPDGRIADRVKVDLLKANKAWSLASSGSWTDGVNPTPGQANP